MKKYLSVSVALGLCYGTLASAQDSASSEEMLVTASRIEQSAIKVLASTSVITEEDIQRSQAVSLPDVLQRLPGISIDHNGGLGANAAIRMRGTESDQVLILIDGVRTSSASNGATALQHIPVDQIERIEVVRGPRSSLYGAEAMGGVIQVFTKRGSDDARSFSPNAHVEYGSHETAIASAGFSGKAGDTRYNFQLGHKDSDGMNRTVGSTGADTDDDGYRESNLSTAVEHRFNNNVSAGFSYLLSQGTTEFDGGSADDETEFENESISTFLSAALSKQLSTRIELGRYRDDQETLGSFNNIFNTKRKSALLQTDYALTGEQTLTAGFEYYVDAVNSSEGFTEDERDNEAVFVQYLANLGRFSVQSSLREDDNEAFGNATTGSLALGVTLASQTTVSLSYGTAFKPPTFNDLYYPFTDFGFGYTFVGNPDLDPEESETLELAVRSRIDQVSLSLAVYKTNIDDLIVSAGSTMDNIDESDILGAEASLQMPVLGWSLDFSVEYVDAVDADTDKRLEYRPRGKATLDLYRQFGRWDVTLCWLTEGSRVTGGNDLGGYNVTDLKVGYNASNALTVGFNVGNIFDNDYTLIDSFRTYRTEGQTAAVFARYAL